MDKMSDKNLYEILHLKSDAEIDEIKAAYRRLARIYHPDISESAESINIFKEIRQAYDILSDPSKKEEYDLKNGFNINQKNNDEKTSDEIINNENLLKNDTDNNVRNKTFSQMFSDIIEGIFIQVKRAGIKNKLKSQKDNDIYANVTISAKEALIGTTRIINVMQTALCPNCLGKKFINEALCPLCKGTGEISNHKKINVKIPSNTKNGQKIKIEYMGCQNSENNKNGDLYLIINIDEKSLFTVKDDIVYMDLPIATFEAALGTNIKIPTFYQDIIIKIPPNTSSGQKFRLKGQGIYNKETGLSGDMIVTVFIKIPKKLSEKEIELFKELMENNTCDIREGLINNE